MQKYSLCIHIQESQIVTTSIYFQIKYPIILHDYKYKTTRRIFYSRDKTIFHIHITSIIQVSASLNKKCIHLPRRYFLTFH